MATRVTLPNLYYNYTQSTCMETAKQHAHIAALQSRWRADAMRDARYNLNRAKIERARGNYVLARGYVKEYKWDLLWGARRGRIVKNETREARRG